MQPKKSVSSLEPSSLCLVEMGRFNDLSARVVAANLQALMGIHVDHLKPLGIPREAFLERRGQYDAGAVIRHVSGSGLPQCRRVLVLTTVDLCSPILTYVYGEAELGGRVAIVSNFRLRCDGDGREIPVDRYYERLIKVALHEVGHTFSLYHCDDPRCLMQLSPGILNLDALDIRFCERCEFMLRGAFKHSPA
jgi:archaemetzincin